MGGVPTKHHTRSKTGNRRSHLAMKKAKLLVCKNCEAPAAGAPDMRTVRKNVTSHQMNQQLFAEIVLS